MNKLLALLLLLPFITFSQHKSAGIRILQDRGVTLYDFETTLYLKKAPFKIQVMLENVSGIYVFANMGDSVYRFSETDSIRDFIYLPILELKAEPFSGEKELIASRTGWSNWQYDPVKPHSFEPEIYRLFDERTVYSKWIRHFYDIANDRQICFEEVDKPLYLFFIAVAEYDKDGKPAKELLRRKVKIVWVNDYYE